MLTPFVIIILIVAVVAYLWFTFAIIYHLVRFGIGNRPKIIALVFLAGSFILFIVATTSFVVASLKFKSIISSIVSELSY